MSATANGIAWLVELSEARAMTRDGRAKQLRIDKNLSQGDVGKLCGVTQSTVSKWEDGHRMPRGEAGRRYAALLAALGKT